MFPKWFEEDKSYSLSEYIIAFIEQVIMIKFLFNYGKAGNTTSIYSLINEMI